jgi:hypothetical protein
MAKRGLRFYCAFVARYYLLDLPGILLQSPALWMFPSEVRNGISIVDPMPQTRIRFSMIVGQALDLVATSDPGKFGRIRTQLRTIANVAGIVGSVYQPAFKLCAVNLRCFDCQADTRRAVEFLASTFLRDATVGYLLNQGVIRTRRNRDRFDRLCCREAQRFMQRLGTSSTPWDAEHLSRLGFGEALTIWLMDTAAAEREAGKELHE